MSIDRRGALALLGGGAAATGVSAQTAPAAFEHGVASGDPTREGAILWTRTSGAATLQWQVSSNAAFNDVVRRGTVRTDAGRDFTAKVDVTGLRPGRDYFYRFLANGQAYTASPTGRFRTLPERTEDVVLAVVSCALHPGGLFNAYEALSKLPRVDAVVHLGDYIYEYGAGDADYGVRIGRTLNRIPQPPREIITLADYRLRHAQYKADPDLQAAHARAAWITVWDDHEVTNDGWLGGAENHDPDTGEGDWAARKAAALKAYYEWMPIREPARGRSAEMIDRTYRFGDVATLHMVETRLLARSKQLTYDADLAGAGGTPDLTGFRAKLNAPDRNLLGETQLRTLRAAMTQSARAGVTWQVLGNQVVMGRVRGPDLGKVLPAEQMAGMMAALDPAIRPRVERLARLFVNDLPFNLDAWDGYPAERERFYGAVKAAGAHPIVLAGDSHAFWVNDLKDAAGTRVGAEFGTTSVTSPGFGDVIKGFDMGAVVAAQNEEVVFSDQSAKGFVVLTLTKAEARAELMAVSTILAKPYETRTLGRFRVRPARGAGVLPVERA
jgi:alkaline phosphatase D